jgi:hypothetical protein
LALLFSDVGPQLIEFEPTGPDADHHAVVQLGTATTNKRGITTARGKERRNVQVAAVLARMATYASSSVRFRRQRTNRCIGPFGGVAPMREIVGGTPLPRLAQHGNS